jgi:hypothetical protein
MKRESTDEEQFVYEALLQLRKEVDAAGLNMVADGGGAFKVQENERDVKVRNHATVWVPTSNLWQPSHSKFNKFAVLGSNAQFDDARQAVKHIENKLKLCKTLSD